MYLRWMTPVAVETSRYRSLAGSECKQVVQPPDYNS
jgi:hypothetical protein